MPSIVPGRWWHKLETGPAGSGWRWGSRHATDLGSGWWERGSGHAITPEREDGGEDNERMGVGRRERERDGP